jgi:hypothetical protein
MNIIKNLTHLVDRIRKDEENIRSLFLRALFWPNKYRFDQVKVVEEDWKNLIVLDACRFDLFEQVNEFEGILDYKYSKGTHTVEWAKDNFDEDLDDIVYISGNPQVSTYKLRKWTGNSQPFHHLENVWQYGWDEEQNTVPPGEVVDAASELKEQYPEKRFIIHFLQPHHPFVGEETLNTSEHQNDVLNSMDWRPVLDELDVVQIKDSFQKNLELTLNEIEKLNTELDSRTIITADHGEMYGEYGLYGHVPALYSKQLTKVPWCEISK